MASHKRKKTSTKKYKPSLLSLAALSFVLIATCALSLSKSKEPKKEIKVTQNIDIPYLAFSPLPVLSEGATYPDFSATSVIAMDLASGVTLYEKNADQELFPASTTKIITALVVLDTYNLDDVVTVKSTGVAGQKMGLELNEQLTVSDLLSGMLIYSANDAAEALASHHPFGRQAFIDEMNLKAAKLHLSNSRFTNPSGLEDAKHLSTARDMARVAIVAMQNPIFSRIVSTQKTTVYNTDKSREHKLTNINKLLGTVDGVLGVKTGWTEHAKENLVTLVERDGKVVVISLLGSDDRFGETTRLIEWVYGSYVWKPIILP